MYEKRKMWMVDNTLDKVWPVVVLYDVEKDEVIGWKILNDDGEEESGGWGDISGKEHFFTFEAAARDFRSHCINEAKKKMAQCLALIKELDGIIESEDFKFKRSDYLGFYAGERWRLECSDERDKAFLCCNIVRTGCFNVNGETVKVADVEHVLWHDNKKATLVLNSGHKVFTCNDMEYDVLTYIFGRNCNGIVCRTS